MRLHALNSGMSCPPPDGFDETDDEPTPDSETDPKQRGNFTRASPLTFVVPEPMLLRVERVDRPGAGEGEQPVAFTRAGPKYVLLAVNAYPAQLVNAFFASDAFGEPVILIGAAWEEQGGIRGELSALLPQRTMRAIRESASDNEDADERAPWASSATPDGKSYEEAIKGDDDGEPEGAAEPHFPLVIGAVIRFPENRKFPNDFELEVDDLMRSILEGRAVDAAEKRIDNLLGGI